MKVYEVEVSLTMYVVANSEFEAKETAYMYANEQDIQDEDACFMPEEVRSINEVHECWLDDIPYGSPNDMTVKDYLEADDE